MIYPALSWLRGSWLYREANGCCCAGALHTIVCTYSIMVSGRDLVVYVGLAIVCVCVCVCVCLWSHAVAFDTRGGTANAWLYTCPVQVCAWGQKTQSPLWAASL